MKMEIFLRYLSDPGFQTGVGYDIGVDQSTVSKTFSEVLDKIVEKANEWIKFPTTADEVNTAKEEWNTRFHMPTVVGALDCTHIMIKKPSLYGDEYINRKGKASINVQATCESFEKITSIEAQWPGSVHDGRIWRNSNVQQVLRLFDGSACLLGDKRYNIAPWILTPFTAPAIAVERLYNLTHSQERVIIERVFGQIKQRFPILNNRVRIALKVLPKLAVSCAVLHSISKHLNDAWEFEYPGNEEAALLEHYDFDNNENRIRQRGEVKRREIVRFLSAL